MTRFVGLLRGVNVGGVNMKMVDLAEVVRALGYDGVKTVLASGNVLFTTDDDAATAKERLEGALRKRFGYEAWVHVLTQEALHAIVEAFPYPRDASRHAYIVFAMNAVVREELLAVELDDELEKAQPGDGVLYWTVPKGATLDSALGKAQGSGKHKQWLTTRNVNTLEKLLR